MENPPDAKELSALTKEEWKEYTNSVWNIAEVKDKFHPTVFPAEIPKRLTKLFSFWGETVLDPFGGVGTTAFAAIREGRRAICIDTNPLFVKEMQLRMRREALDLHDLEVRVGDARNLPQIQDNSIDLIVTSPPYWDKIKYGDADGNIGNAESYVDFLNELRRVFEECRRILVPGRKLCLIVANVNQMTDHGLLTFPLSTDITMMLRDIGMMMTTEIIWTKNSPDVGAGRPSWRRPMFGSYPYPPNFLFSNVHEHILVFAKPGSSRCKGPKVRLYKDVMTPRQLACPPD